MKLWVDDIRQAPDDTWTVARTATAAIRAIARYDFEVISLDHDISHQVTVGALGRPYPCDETFESVAYYIVAKHWVRREDRSLPELAMLRPHLAPKIIIHTSNTVAGDRMAQMFKDADIPFEKKYMGAANRLEMETH